MTIEYIKLSPTGNITLLVPTPVPRALQPQVARALLARVGGEQVGYIEGDARLQMMGGEFCGNATMSLGALLARDRGLAPGEALALSIGVSGADGPVPCRIEAAEDAWLGTVRMPLPTGIAEASLETDAGTLVAPLVRLPGIAHLILPAERAPSEEELRRRLPEWNGSIGADALGALRWDAGEGAIDPLVCVPSAGTLVREHGCGSGSAALGCWLAHRAGSGVEVPVRQPGGTITVRVEVSGDRLTGVTITGRVTLLEEGTTEIEL